MSAPRVRRSPANDRVATDDVARALAQLGGVATPARRAIIESMLEAGRLQSPEALLRAARTRVPGTSLATVYRTLDRLAAAGAVKRATLASGEIGYAYCPSGHHEHAICLRCGRLRPIRPCLIKEKPSFDGFSVTSHVLDFYGVCAACATGDEAGAGPVTR
jgi:Fur family ferric uptake transcriptional regulator